MDKERERNQSSTHTHLAPSSAHTMYRARSMHFSSVSLLMNESVEEDVRGTMNGLSTLGGSVAKGAAPLFAGVCYAYCVNNEEVWSARAGAFIAFATTASFAVVIAVVAMRDKSFKGERFDS